MDQLISFSIVVRGVFFVFLFKSGDPDQTARSVASDLDLYVCLCPTKRALNKPLAC